MKNINEEKIGFALLCGFGAFVISFINGTLIIGGTIKDGLLSWQLLIIVMSIATVIGFIIGYKWDSSSQ